MLNKIYLLALYAYLYIQTCALMGASYLEDNIVHTSDRSN